MNERIRVGVVGTSWYADLMHLPILHNHRRAETVAICGRNITRAQEMASKYGIGQTYTDYRAMIEQADLNAVIIAVPDDLHYPIAMASLDAGLHVLCEKPLANTAEDAANMLAMAEAAGVKHMTYFTWRWLAPYRYVRQLLDDGYIGACHHCHFRYMNRSQTGEYDWHFDSRRATGVLGNFGSHMIDLARHFVGDIKRVSAQLSTFEDRPGPGDQHLDPANDAALLSVQFENGAQGVIHVSAVAHVGNRQQEQQVLLHGEAGTLEVGIDFLDGYTVRGTRDLGEPFTLLPVPQRFVGNVESNSSVLEQIMAPFQQDSIGTRLFIDAIVEDQVLAPSFYDGFKIQQVIGAAVESDRNDRWVDLT